MENIFLTERARCFTALCAVAAVVAAMVVGCSREDGAATAATSGKNAANGSAAAEPPKPAEPEKPMTAEEKEAAEMRDLLDSGETTAAIRHARNLMDSKSTQIKGQVLETLSWIGRRALPEITEMINDADGGIAAEAISAWDQAFGEIMGPNRQALAIAETVVKLKNPDHVSAIFMHCTELDESISLPMVAEVIAANSTNIVGECGREIYKHLSGGEIYESPEATRRFLEEEKSGKTVDKKGVADEKSK